MVSTTGIHGPVLLGGLTVTVGGPAQFSSCTFNAFCVRIVCAKVHSGTNAIGFGLANGFDPVCESLDPLSPTHAIWVQL